MDHKTLLTIKDWYPPNNVQQLQLFLCLANYYRRFIKDFVKKVHPLNNLLIKEKVFVFSDDCLLAFNGLKKLMTSDLVFSVIGQKDTGNKENVRTYSSLILEDFKETIDLYHKFGHEHYEIAPIPD